MHLHLPAVGATLAALLLLSPAAVAQLALSANDGKAVLVDGVNTVPANPAADSVTVIDLKSTRPRPSARCRSRPASSVRRRAWRSRGTRALRW